MCENKSLEKSVEDLKQVVHSQHARILKEDDEIWISSEDLNTENSSDEDKSKMKLAFRKKLKPKNRKRSSPNIRLQRPSIPSMASTSQQLDNRLLMPQTPEDPQSRSTDESRTSDEEYNIPSIASECLSKRLSLEDWRPTRGSLTISSLEETASAAGNTRKIVNETGNFFKSMMDKLKTLKNCPVLSVDKEKKDLDQTLPSYKKTFKYLKNTPEVKRTLEAIRAMDEEISQVISQYKLQRKERLSTEFEVCKNIVEQKIGEEHGTEVFLRLSGFDENLRKLNKNKEPNQDGDEEGEAENFLREGDSSKGQQSSVKKTLEYSVHYTNYIERNKLAAKSGMMACFSLTDEEKARIEKLMEDFGNDIDKYDLNNAELTLSSITLTEENPSNKAPENKPKEQREVASDEENAFWLAGDDKNRLAKIDKELETFVKDESLLEKLKKPLPPIKNEDEFWKIFILDKSMREVDNKLEALQASYLEDEQKLKHNDDDDDDNEKEEEYYNEKLKELMAKVLKKEET